MSLGNLKLNAAAYVIIIIVVVIFVLADIMGFKLRCR